MRSTVLILFVLQSGQRVRAIQLKQFTRPSQFSDGKSIYTGEPLPYQFKPQLSREGDDIPVDVPGTYQTRYVSNDLRAVWTV